MLDFRPIASVAPGTTFQLLIESYEGWSGRDEHMENWRIADHDFFSNPDTVGECALFTFLADEAIEFVSWDPRRFPTAVIGHNCVRPSFRGRGIGKAQLRNLLRILRNRSFREATVTTGPCRFFEPARRMYLACGFEPVPTASASGDPTTMDYRVDLRSVFSNEVDENRR
jgi:GNAT superfamily N-acetyltransferase